MTKPDKFSLLKKLLKALGLSDERVEELIGRIQTWLQEDAEKQAGQPQFPYLLREEFLSPAELNFYRVLQIVVADWATPLVKVSLGDLFYVQTGDFGRNQAYRNKIDRKHVDFLLCDPQSMRPLLGIELDDKSHRRADRQKRDRFLNHVFAAAQLPLVHIPVKRGYATKKLNQFLRQKAGIVSDGQSSVNGQSEKFAPSPPACPKCGAEMVQRTARSGANAGKVFWGCTNYPRCRGIVYRLPA